MSMDFNLLSKNTIILMNQILENPRLMKLIVHSDPMPLHGESIEHTGQYINTRIFPSPFAGRVPEVEEVYLRVYFPKGYINHRVVLGSTVAFEIVIPHNLWLMRDAEERQSIRPYEIMAEIVKQFEDKSIGTLGIIHFQNFDYYHINSAWGVYTLYAQMTTL